MIIALTLLLGNVLWNGSIAKGSDFEGEADNPTDKKKKMYTSHTDFLKALYERA